MGLPVNEVIVGNCTEVMRTWPADSIDLVVTSPPYWGLRDYGEETVRVWGGRPECEHEWAESESGLVHENRNFSRGSQEEVHGERETTWIRKYDSQKAGFCSKCGAWCGSLGLEPHPQMFIDHLVEICREIRRVLKPSGTFWLNLGDTYASMKGKCYNPGGGVTSLPQDAFKELAKDQNPNRMLRPDGGWLQPKQKLMMPARVAIALQHDGWILRNDVIWFKPNHMPSSVKDRLTCAYEHVFLFAKARRYYFDLDAIRKPFSKGTFLRIRQPNIANQSGGPKTLALRGESPESGNASRPIDMAQELSRKIASGEITGKNPGDVWEVEEENLTKHDIALGRINRSYTDPLHTKAYHPLGKNPGDVLSGSKYLEQDHPHSIRVKGGHTGDYTHPRGKNPGDLWRIPTTPFPGAHFAVFPVKLIEPIVKAGSPRWICNKCGKPRKRITEPTPAYAQKLGKSVHDHKDDLKRGMRYDTVINAEYVTTGWSDCGCDAGWNPSVVLDPFGGSGTVGQVARKLGRRFILIEIKTEYAEMARQRVRGKYKPTPLGVVQLDKIMEAEE